MAFPSIPTTGGGRALVTTQANATSPRTFPNLSSLTKNSGDLLIAIVVAYQSSAGAGAPGGTVFSSWGGGFTEFCDQMTTNSSTMAIGAAYKFSDGTETGTFTVAQAATITGHAALILLSISGAHASTPPEVGVIANGTAAGANPGSFDPAGWAAEDTLWVAVGASGEVSTTGSYTGITNSPTNYSGDVLTAASGDVAGAVQGGVGFRQNNASSEDAGAWAVDTSNARNSALVIAVRPAAAQNFSQPVNDAIAGTDANAKAVGSTKTEAPTITDAQTRVWAAKQAPADAIAGTDAQAKRVVSARLTGGAAGTLFDGVDDTVLCGPGTLTDILNERALTLIAVARPTALSADGFYFSVGTPTGTYGHLVAFGTLGSGQSLYTAFNDGLDVEAANVNGTRGDWQMLAMTMPAGAVDTVIPRFHRKLFGAGAWAHNNSLLGPLAQSSTEAAENVRINGAGPDPPTGVKRAEISVIGILPDVNLSDAEIEAIYTASSTQAILDECGAEGVVLNLNHAGPFEDATGGGADETSRTGTTFPASTAPGWDYGDGPATGDALAAADAAALAAGKALSEAPTVADTFAKIWAPIRTQDDAIGGTDAQAKAAGKAQADAIGGTDFMDIIRGIIRAMDDPFAGTDASFRSAGKAQADAIGGTDAQATVWTASRIVSDAITGTDALQKALATLRADSLGAADAFATSWVASRALSDLLAASDLETHSWTAQRAIDDAAAGTDAQSTQWDALRTISDALSAADAMDAQFAGQLQKTLGDQIAATDAIQKASSTFITDLVLGTDASVRASAKALTDAIQGTDAQGKATAISMVDSLVAMDAMSRQWDAIVAIADALHGTDATQTEFSAGGNNLTLTINDSFGAGDSLGRAWDADLAIDDALTAADTFARSIQALRTIQDAIGIVDEIDFPFTFPWSPWRRTQLDDRPEDSATVAAPGGTIRGPENPTVTGPDETDVTPL